jgi:hypothetical protein
MRRQKGDEESYPEPLFPAVMVLDAFGKIGQDCFPSAAVHRRTSASFPKRFPGLVHMREGRIVRMIRKNCFVGRAGLAGNRSIERSLRNMTIDPTRGNSGGAGAFD